MKFLLLFLVLIFSSISFGAEDAVIFNDDYNTSVELSIEDNKPLIVIFSAEWCEYCNKLKGEVLENFLIKDSIICIIDTDKNKSLTKKFKIKTLPTSIILINGVEQKRKIGYKNSKDYVSWSADSE